MLLPNYKNALIDDEKLIGYSLNIDHPVGSNKARVFKSALGFEQSDYPKLKALIANAIGKTPCKKGRDSVHGLKYVVDFEYLGVEIRTAWIIDVGENFPRLTTCYVI